MLYYNIYNILLYNYMLYYNIYNIKKKGGYPDLNRKHIVPHTIALPIELYPPIIHITL